MHESLAQSPPPHKAAVVIGFVSPRRHRRDRQSPARSFIDMRVVDARQRGSDALADLIAEFGLPLVQRWLRTLAVEVGGQAS